MAGGMTTGGDETLLQRVTNTRANEAARQGGHGTHGFHGKRPADWADVLRDLEPQPALPVKHCWYDGPNGRQPGLLLRWRSIQGHYDGLVIVPVLEDGRWVIVEMWVDAAMLSPA